MPGPHPRAAGVSQRPWKSNAGDGKASGRRDKGMDSGDTGNGHGEVVVEISSVGEGGKQSLEPGSASRALAENMTVQQPGGSRSLPSQHSGGRSMWI